MATTAVKDDRARSFLQKFIVPFAWLGISKARSRLVQLLALTLATLLFYRKLQPKTKHSKYGRSLSLAPRLSKYVFLLPNKGFAQTLINQFEKFKMNGDKLGCIWFGQKKIVVVVHPDTARQVLKQPKLFVKGEVLNFLSSPMKVFYVDDNGKKLPDLGMSNGDEYDVQRKHISLAFKTENLELLIPKFLDEADFFLKLHAQKEEVDVTDAVFRFAVDVLSQALLGRNFQAQAGRSIEGFWESYLTIVRSMGDPLFNLFPILFDLPLEKNRKLYDAVEKVKSVLWDCYNERRSKILSGQCDPKTRCIVDCMVYACDTEEFPKDCILGNMWSMFFAGHDTTASTLAWLLNSLAQHPEVQQKAHEEIKEVLGDKIEGVTVRELDQLKYVNAVIKESLRLNPPGHNIPTRKAAEDTEIDGYFVPKGTYVSLGIHAVNRHADFWKEPTKFNPERFMDAKVDKARDPFAFLSFSHGYRKCIGGRFSLIEQRCLLAKILLDYEIVPRNGKPSYSVELPLSNSSFSAMLKQPKPFFLKFVPRKKSEA